MPTRYLTTHYLLSGQGFYYLVTGIWPLVSPETFFAVTGPKTDIWLVKSFGALVGLMGAVFLIAAVRRAAPLETVVLSLGAAVILLLVDVIFVAGGVISPVYLLDGAVEFGIAVCWCLLLLRGESLLPG